MQYYELLIAVLGEPRLGKDTNQDQSEEETQMSKSLKEEKKMTQKATKELEEGMGKCHKGHSCLKTNTAFPSRYACLWELIH